MHKLELFPFQREAVDACIAHTKKKNPRPGIVVGPVAFGKSLVISEVARISHMKTIVLQPSAELLSQNYDKLIKLGGEATIYSASLNTKEISELMYATLGSVKNLGKDFRKLGIELVIVDEAHSGYPPDTGSTFMNFIKDLSPKCVLGFTATPLYLKAALGGSKLSLLPRVRPSFFKEFTYIMQVSEIIKHDRWTPVNYKSCDFDEKELILNTSGSDFTEESMKRYNEAKGINNKIYLEVTDLLAQGVKNILVFCDSVDSAITFSKNIPNSSAVFGDMSKKERKAVLDDFQSEKIHVVFNYSVLGIGYDHPSLTTVIMGRPTNSFAIYYQIYGRLVRKFEGKLESSFIDYGGNYARFGPVEDISLEEHEINGWSLFSGDRLITGVPMGGPPVFRSDFKAKLTPIKMDKDHISLYIMTFGKHQGVAIERVPREYLEWIIYQSGWDFIGEKMLTFKRVATKYLEDTKMSFIN